MTHRFRVTLIPELHILMHNLKPVLRHAMLATLRTECVNMPCEIHMALVDESTIRRLNREHRDIDKVTDVLSFPYQRQFPGKPLFCGPGDVNPKTGRLMLGDIILCMPQTQKQAREAGHSLEKELSFLTVHSTLHLLGYDHAEDSDEELMREHEHLAMEAMWSS